jgi:DNA polymerase III sliding clamp (beta) subunit (PCNA family)
MRIEIDGNELANALRGSPRGKSTLPILQHALLDASEGRLRVQTTDLEAYSCTDIAAKVIEPGSVSAKADLLLAAARPGVLKFAHKDEDPNATANPHGGSRLRIPTLKASDFPAMQEGDWHPLPIEPAALAVAIERVFYAAGSIDYRGYLNTLCIGKGFIGASDSYRGALHDFDYAGPALLVPNKQVREFAKMLTAESALSVLGQNPPRMLRVTNGATMLSVSLVEGQYPDIESVFPIDIPKVEPAFVFDRENLLQSAQNFLPFTTVVATKLPTADLVVENGGAYLRDRAATNEENCSWALGEHTDEGRISIRLDFVIATLSAMRADKVRLCINRGRSIVLTPVADVIAERHIITGVV